MAGSLSKPSTTKLPQLDTDCHQCSQCGFLFLDETYPSSIVLKTRILFGFMSSIVTSWYSSSAVLFPKPPSCEQISPDLINQKKHKRKAAQSMILSWVNSPFSHVDLIFQSINGVTSFLWQDGEVAPFKTEFSKVSRSVIQGGD